MLTRRSRKSSMSVREKENTSSKWGSKETVVKEIALGLDLKDVAVGSH